MDGGLEGRKRRIPRKFCHSIPAELFLFRRSAIVRVGDVARPRRGCSSEWLTERPQHLRASIRTDYCIERFFDGDASHR